MRHRKQFHQARVRSTWLGEFERQLIAARPELSGRIDWDSAIFLFNQGVDPAEAARRCAITMRPQSPRFPTEPMRVARADGDR